MEQKLIWAKTLWPTPFCCKAFQEVGKVRCAFANNVHSIVFCYSIWNVWLFTDTDPSVHRLTVGLFTCEYTKGSIMYTASEALDVALLPDIRARSSPQFPDCSDSNQKVLLTFQCVIKVSTENYTVSWTSSEFTDLRSKSSGKNCFCSRSL